jgi:hypothetical protein
MLPPRLEKLRASLKAKTASSEHERELTRELEFVANALEEASRGSRVLREELKQEELKHTFAKGASAWGGDPGRCYLCGK